MPKIENENKEPKFYSLFVPQIDWFQKLMNKKSDEGSLSDILIDLSVRDLRSRKLVSAKEMSNYEEYQKQKPEIKDTRFKGERTHSTFSLYIPKNNGVKWIREKLDSTYVKEHCKVKSRSLYIWDLFVKDHKNELDANQLREWNEAIRPKGKGKKAA